MKIAIDVRAASGKRLGKGVYTHCLVQELLKLDKENEYLLLTNGPLDFEVGEKVAVWSAPPSPLWHVKARQKILGYFADIFLAPTSFIIPALLPSSVRSVVVVHDLVAFLFPKEHQTKATLTEKLFIRKALRKASALVVVSENTKRDLVQLFPWVGEKTITVVYPAASELYFQEISPEELEEFRKLKQLPEKFFLTVGTLEPRKNLEILLQAYEALGDKNLGLVIVGSEGWKNKKILQKISKLQTTNYKLQTLPYLPESDLVKLYRLAEAFVFPSRYEGFGIPALEAMASGCPVISSNAASLPEVCGEAALLFEPKDVQALTSHLQRILADERLRKALREKGFAQAKKFSWKISAEKIRDCLRACG